MRLSNILLSASTALLSSLPATTARITGFYAPATVVPGESLSILIRAENYVQSVQDVAMAFGITPVESYYPGTLGTFMGEKSIGPGECCCNPDIRFWPPSIVTDADIFQ
jgi:hypothetical protein